MAQSPISEVRTNATNFLDQELHRDPGRFLFTLSKHVSEPSGHLSSRQLAGYYIKNTITNSTENPRLVNLWTFISPETKQDIKSLTLSALADESREIRQVAAQIISFITRLELPYRQWPEVLPILIANGTNVNPVFKEAALMTLGYICEIIPNSALQKEEADSVLTVIVAGLNPEEKNLQVIKTSLSALKNSLKFIKCNIEAEEERKVILNVLYGLCTHPSSEIRREGLGVICDIGYFYYGFIESDLMNLGSLTYNVINNDEVSVALVGVEFWNIIGDIEVSLLDSKSPSRGYISTAASTLVPILLQKVHIFDDDSDDSDWNLYKSCGISILNIALIIKDPIVDLVTLYISKNLNSPNWKLRRSAVLVFGSILEGPSVNSLTHLIVSSASVLIALLRDENFLIRQVTAWCISRIFGFYTDIFQVSACKDLIQALKSGLSDLPSVVTYICEAILKVTDYKEFSTLVRKDDIDSMFNSLASICIGTGPHDYKVSSFAALTSVIEKAPKECLPMISSHIEFFIDMIQKSSKDMQVMLFGLLHYIFARASIASISEEIADKFMTIVIQIFNSQRNIVQEAIEAAGLLADVMQYKFERYVQSLVPVLIWGIDDTSASSVCRACVMCVGDLSRGLSLKFTPYIMHFIPKFLNILASTSVDLSIKIDCIGSLADMVCVPGVYLKYMGGCLEYIDGAAGSCLKPVSEDENPDLFDAVNSLREAVLGFYISLVDGLKESGAIGVLIGHVEKLIDFCLLVTQEGLKCPDGVHLCAIGLLGDIAAGFGDSAKYAIGTPEIKKYIEKYMGNANPSLREAAKYSHEQILAL